MTQRKTKSKGCIDYCRHKKRGTIEKGNEYNVKKSEFV